MTTETKANTAAEVRMVTGESCCPDRRERPSIAGAACGATALLFFLLSALSILASVPGLSQAAAFNEQEYFDTANTVNDWTNWQPTDVNGTPNGSPGSNGWLMTRNTATATNGSTLTPSAGTGPTSVHSGGASGGFLFLENSGTPPWPDRYFTRKTAFDGSTHNLNISFAYSMYGAGMGTLQLQVNDGSGWTTEWQRVGDDGQGGAWTAVSIDLFNGGGLTAKRYYGGPINLRFRFVSGSTYQGDAAIDTLRVFGNEACTETATVSLNTIPPITAPTNIVASLGGVGGSNPQVSTDGVTWQANGWTYVPPVSSSGVQYFYARATGFCGTYVTDPFNPTPVNYDTTCTDPDPSTINIPVGQTVSGSSIGLTSLFTPTGDVGSFTYRINGAAVATPWSSSAYGTASPEVVTLQITGTDPDCGGKTLVRTGYITVDNTCITAAPSFGFDRHDKYSAAGSSVNYTVTVYNNDVGTCPSEDFTISAIGDSHANFTGTITGPAALTIAPGAAASTTLRVAVAAGTPDWTTNDTTVRVVAAAHAGPANQPAQTTAYRMIPLMHNSASTYSEKHGGKWGTSQAGSKYGAFSCETCHQKGSTNSKGVRTVLGSAPDTGLGNFPGSGAAINFTDVRNGSSDFGDDSRAVKTSSNYICEVCHTYDATQSAGVNKHAFNMSTPGNSGHYNKQDCTACHRHSEGFKAGCTACHGDEAGGNVWPDNAPNAYPDRIGAHGTHVAKIGNYIASGNKDNSSFTTLDDKNASCGFCHPDAGGTNVDGAPHDVDTIGSAASVGDVHGDGLNSSYFKYLDGSNDPDGTFNASLKRCSNIDCHSNGQFTWSWYGDSLAPALVSTLSATSGTEIGTVDLSWTAPGNDGSTAGKPYRYEVRYSTSPIGSEAAWSGASVAGGPPTTKWPGSTQNMTVEGLNPGTLYYFAVKTADELGNWSALSSPNPSATARSDTEAPVFRGLETASPVFTTGDVSLSWAAATDHSEPVDYLIWWTTSDQSINYGAAPNAVTTGLTYLATGLTNGTNYIFAVRARDAAANVDDNTVQKEAIPQVPPEKEWLGKTYYALRLNNSACGTTLNYAGALLNGSLAGSYDCGATIRNRLEQITANADIARWIATTPYAQTTNITGGFFRVYVQERAGVQQQVTIKIGYADNTGGTNYVQLGSQVKTIKASFRGSTSFSLGTITGQIPAGKYLVMYFSKTSGGASELRIRYGSERYRSELTIYEQLANARPNAFTVNTPAPGVPAGAFDINWTAAVDPDGDPVQYDAYAQLSDGTMYVIANKTSLTTASWDSAADQVGVVAPATNVVIKVEATDGLSHNEGGTFYDHREAVSGTFTVNNTTDISAPAPIYDLTAEARPKSGSVYLYWSAPGDDGLIGQAGTYDIRYSPSIIDASNFAAATQVSGEPVPGPAGHRQGYEVLGLTAGQTYYFAMKTADEVPNWSGISNVPAQKGGLACGVCHSTPPDEAGRAGTHEQHGYTQVDCAKCHGSESINYNNNHSDGVNKLSYNNPKKGFANTAYKAVVETDTRVTYHAGGTAGGTVLYDDTTGGGGFNDLGALGDNNDNGSCFSFNATGVTGCHGAAGSDPDGAGPLPTYPAPQWGDLSSVSCAMCHGDPSRANATPYNRPYEDGTRDTKYAGNVKKFKSAPGIDLSGSTSSNAVGQHLRHLNFSYRFTGDSCALCHLGNEHADGTVDVNLDKSISGANAQWNPAAGGAGTPGTCSGTSELRCHGNNAVDPQWKPRDNPNVKLVECNECHGFSGKTYVVGNPGSSQIPHVKDGGQVRHCTWCHVEGHPREGYSISAATKANPVVLTSAKHGLETGDTVVLHVEGMTELDHEFSTVTVIDANSFSMDGINSTGYGTFTSGHWKRSYDAKSITAVTKANPASVTSAGHGLSTGNNVLLKLQGMTQLDGYYGAVTVVDANTFTLDGVNSSSYGTFTSGSWIPDDGAILLPNYSIAGIDYSSGGIHLKRVVNGRNNLNNGELIDTEAETCWGCHEDQAPAISEWGTNTKALTGSSSYDYGSLNQASWVGAVWSSANFSYKDGAIQSTHSVNPKVLAPGADTAADLRCSYCHDVHDLNKAIGDSSSGAPYLRGSWKGNPYKEDGAPGRNDRGAQTFTGSLTYYPATDDFGGVPRGTPSTSKMGGYWIDQNSAYPTQSWTLANSAGLCTLCHGVDVNNMNKFGNAADAWIGTNGHSNAVIGGSGTNKFNVYDPVLRKEGTTWPIPGMGYQETTGADGTRMYGIRNNNGDASTTNTNSDGIYPYAWNSDRGENRYAYEEFNWGLDRATGAANADLSYHRFSCSKCHNPHASRLPRLMITNCLDISHNTWDNLMVAQTDWTTGQSNGVTFAWKDKGVMPYNGNDPTNVVDKQIAYATSAQNCHRYVEINGKAITAITKANPAVVTSATHGLTTGKVIKLRGIAGMTELNEWMGTVTVLTTNTFSLDGVNSTAYGTFTSGSWNEVGEKGWNKLTPWRE